MEDLPAGPYRSASLAERPAVPPARRPVRLGVVTVYVVAGAVVAALVGVPPVAIMYALPAVAAALKKVGEQRFDRALGRLASLRFPIEHSRRSAIEGQWRSAIRSVTVRLAGRLDRPAIERLAGDAQRRAPGLVVQSKDDALVITAWPWGGDDLLLLADLLGAWAQALHGEHAITAVTVTWSPGGPPCSL